MGLYMVRSNVKPEHRDEILKRYAANPSTESGVTQRGDWVSVLGDGAYHLMETDDPKALANELLKFNDLCTYTVDPVVLPEAFFELLNQHGIT